MMLLAIAREALICFACVLPFLLLFELPPTLRRGKKGAGLSGRHVVINLVFVLLLSAILDVTGIPSVRFLAGSGVLTARGLRIPAEEINLIPFHFFSADIPSELENIVLFFPFGFLLPLLWERYRPLWKTALCGFSFSLLIEISQLFNHRVTDVDDLLMNTLGACAGWLVWRILKNRLSCVRGKATVPEGNEGPPFLLRHEAVFDMAAAFLGMFLLYSPYL